MSTEDDAACGRTLRTGKRTVIEDIETDPPYAPMRPVARAAGYRAVQSTPFAVDEPCRQAAGHGLDTFPIPPSPGRTRPARLDLYVRQAADFIERCRAEQALRESEQRFQTMADTAPAMLWITDPAGHCTFLSRGWYEFTGQTEKTGLGYGWFDAVHPDDRKHAKTIFLAANAKHEPFQIDSRLRRADGEYRWAIDAARPRFSEQGAFLGYIGSVLDITERKQIEESLRESEARTRTILDTALDAIIIINREGRIIGWNPQASVIFGYAVGEVSGRLLSDTIIPQRDREAHARGLRRLLETGVGPILNQRIEVSALHKDGHEFPVELTVSAMQLDGQPVFSAFLRDITARKLAEEALRESETFNRSILESSADCIKVLDSEGRLFSMNVNGQYLMEISDFESFRGKK